MAFRFFVLCATLALASAGDLLSPSVSYATAPLAYSAHAAPLAYSTHSAPLAYSTHAAPLAYSTHTAVPLSYSAPAITSQSSNIYRSAGNLGQISTYSKTIDTPFSSVRKADVRISNPGLKFSTAPAFAYSAPTYAAHATYAAPAAYAAHATYAAPTAYAAHAPLLGVAYSAAPAVAHVAFDSGVAHYAW